MPRRRTGSIAAGCLLSGWEDPLHRPVLRGTSARSRCAQAVSRGITHTAERSHAMRQLRFSIRGLIALVLLGGVGFAALRSATEWWVSGIYTATLIGFALAAVYAANRRG